MLIDEQELVTRVAPSLVRELADGPGLIALEEGGSDALATLFRDHGRPAFLVPGRLGGDGGSLVEIAHLLRWVGARCPSLAIMMTMHHHSVAAFAVGAVDGIDAEPFLRRIAEEGSLVASAFSEGRPGADILDSTVVCRPLEGGVAFQIAGRKKPCSMSHQADLAVVGIAVEIAGGEGGRGIALIERSLSGVGSEDSWPAELFAAAGSHSLILDGVVVPAERVLAPRANGSDGLRARAAVSHAEIALSTLFQLMVSASYLGMASRLCEIALQRRAGTAGERVEVIGRLESATMAVYRLGALMDHATFSGHLLARAMLVGHNADLQIESAVSRIGRILGAKISLGDPEVRYLSLASRCIHFHPPSSAVREQIVDGCYTDVL